MFRLWEHFSMRSTTNNNLRLHACQVKDEQHSTLEEKDEEIRLSLDAWGQGRTDEQHSLLAWGGMRPENGIQRDMNGNVESQIDTLDLDWSALLLCVSFTWSKVQIIKLRGKQFCFVVVDGHEIKRNGQKSTPAQKNYWSPQTFYGCFENFIDCSHYPC